MHICCFIKGTLRWHKKCTFSGWVSLAKNANYFCWSKKKNFSQTKSCMFFFKFEWRNSCLTHTHTHTHTGDERGAEGGKRERSEGDEREKKAASVSLSLFLFPFPPVPSRPFLLFTSFHPSFLLFSSFLPSVRLAFFSSFLPTSLRFFLPSSL